MKKLFRPEFLNRLDEYHRVQKSLRTREQIGRFVELMVADLRDRLIEQDMTINLTDAAREHIADEGTDTSMGARPLRRAIQRLLEDPIAERILKASGMRVGHRRRFRRTASSCSRRARARSPRRASATASHARPKACPQFDLSHAGVEASGQGGGVSGGAAD